MEQGGVVCTERGGSLTQGWLKGKHFGMSEKLNPHSHSTLTVSGQISASSQLLQLR